MTGPRDPQRAFAIASRLYLAAAVCGAALLPATLLTLPEPWADSRLGVLVMFGAAGFVLMWGAFRRLIRSHGPRHTLEPIVLGWTLLLVVPILVDVLRLPEAVYFVLSAFMGAGLAAIFAAHNPLRKAYGRPQDDHVAAALVVGLLALLGATIPIFPNTILRFGLLAVIVASSRLWLAAIPDPLRPGTSPFAVYLPWKTPTAARPRVNFLSRIPAHLTYAMTTLLLFASYVFLFDRDRANVPAPLEWAFVYQVPNLLLDIPRTLVNFATGIWVNHHPVQLVYVFVLSALFGVWFEVNEGSRRAIAVFYGSSIFAGVTAGFLLHVIRALFDAAWIEDAWDHGWTGGSAGAFGLAGGFAARAQKPWLLLSVLLFWETNVELWHLRSYTVAFHLLALACGFVWVRYWMPPRSVASIITSPA